jgi:putative spermidine/putrescine transport system substrate-binding protein
MIGRRQFMAGAAGLAVAAVSTKLMAASNEVVVAVGTGDWGAANIAAYVEPFKRETGIDVKIIGEWFDADAVRRLGESGVSEVDIIPVGHTTVVNATDAGWLEPIDYSLHNPADLDSMKAEAKRSHGLATIYYSINIAYWRDKFENGGPKNWADFWNVEKFPGKRALRSGDYPAGLLEAALLADGVLVSELYPLDIERAFASLDRIRPHIVNWWRDGVDQQKIFADRVVDLGSAFNGRIGNLQKQNMPIELEWNQGFLVLDYFVIPKGSPNRDNAQKFVSFLSRPENQAAFAKSMAYGPTNALAYKLLDDSVSRMMPSHPDNIDKQIAINTDWYMAKDAEGVKNDQRIIDRWKKWSL